MIDNKTRIKIFDKFLDSKNIKPSYYSQASQNILDVHWNGWIANGFHWKMTPEGGDFWLEIHHDWERLRRYINKKDKEIENGNKNS